jgi:anti-anti-sigma regulatory factor
VLLEVLRAARRLNKTFHLSGLRERPRYLLEATRLLHLFDEVSRDVWQ